MIRGKFKVSAVTYHGEPTAPDTPRTYELRAVYDQDTAENARFAKATPWGELNIKIDNPEARLVAGQDYYLDLTPCSEAHPVDYMADDKAITYTKDDGYVGELPDAATHHPDAAPEEVGKAEAGTIDGE
jgi:hypothetical protein